MYSLVIDCSHKENFIGLFEDDHTWLFQQRFSGQPFENLIINLESALGEYDIDKRDISHFFTPDSPGSTLGIRVTQMMIAGFLKTFCRSAQLSYYNGLYMSALSLLEEGVQSNSNNYLITENGRHSWNVIIIDENLKKRPEIKQYTSDALAELGGNFFYIPQLKTWDSPKVKTQNFNYSPDRFLKCIKLLKSINVDTSLLLPTNNSYVKWNQN